MYSEGGFNIERSGRHWPNEKTFQQMNPTFWLKDHLLAYSNRDKEDEDSNYFFTLPNLHNPRTSIKLSLPIFIFSAKEKLSFSITKCSIS
jgi:hypothetical protein